MGCAPSKQSVCRNCHAQCSPARRSSSAAPRRSSACDGGGDRHVVALTSTTLGYLLLDSSEGRIRPPPVRRNATEKKVKDFGVGIGVVDSETWAKMIDEKVVKVAPKTPVETPPGEPETINAWELMEGLDDTSPLRPQTDDRIRCFSFDVNSNSIPPNLDEPVFESGENDRDIERLCKPLWLQLPENHNPDSNSKPNDTCMPSDFDPDSIPAFRNSFEILPPMDNYHLKPLIEKKPSMETKKPLQTGKSEKLILYFTSLRGIRKTYEDCCYVRVILKNSGVRVDERDVSMHSGFKDELKELLGDKYGSGGGGLPKVFLGKNYVGGADEIRRLHDEFQLERVLEGCELAADRGDGGGRGGCEACGDIRFFPCETCSGSCKIYYEVDSDGVENEDLETDYGFQRCPDCNENGLVRCPICCD